MKRLPAILFTIIGAALVCSCGGLKKMPQHPPVAVAAEENLVPRNGVLPIRLTVNIPEEYRSLNNGIQVRPVIKDKQSDKELALAPMVIEGKFNRIFNQRMAVYKPVEGDSIEYRIPYRKKTDTYEYETEIPYESWFSSSEIEVGLTAEAYNKRLPLELASVKKEFTDYAPSICRHVAEKYYFWEKPETAEVVHSGEDTGSASCVTFPIASADLSDNEGKAALENYMAKITTHPEIESYSIEVTIANSPEGSLEANRELSRTRKDAVEKYLLSLDADPAKISYTIIDENWAGLAEALPALELEHQEEILAAIDSIADPDRREIFIRDAYYKNWRQFRKELYPGLRKADISVTATYKGKDDFFVSGDGFSFEEDPLAKAHENHDQLLDAVKDKNYELAAEFADQIPNTGVPAKVLSNKATVYLMTGRLEDARVLLERLKDCAACRSNLGMVYLEQEKYNEAAEILEGEVSINAAIAKMYLGEYKEAADILSMLPASEQKASLENFLKEALK